MALLHLAVCFVLLAICSASLTVPGSILAPLGAPTSVGPNGITAMKYAVGGRLMNMLGSGGYIPGGSVMNMDPYGGFGGGFPGFPPLTPRSKELTRRRGPSIPQTFDIRTAKPNEIENFFGVLHKVDANRCISRMVCEVGADPKVVEGLGHNIKDVMTSLKVLEKNALSQKYKEIMLQGQKDGFQSCGRNYKSCDEKAYRLVKTFVKAFKVKS